MGGTKSGDTYHAARANFYTIAEHRLLVDVPEWNQSAEIDPDLARVLALCQGYRTLDHHVTAVCRALGSSDRVGIQGAIEQLVLSGLLQTGPFGERPARVREQKLAAITTVGIATADRPEALRRCLRTCSDHGKTYGRQPRVLVVDGSCRQDNRDANRAAVSEMSRVGDSNIAYVGPAEACAIRRSVAQYVESSAVLEHGLTSGATGSNRNLLMLLTAGEHILLLDDDVVCTGWGPATERRGILVAGHEDLRVCGFFSTRAEALAEARTRRPVDVFRAHEEVLGQLLTTLCDAAQADTDLQFTCGHVVTALERKQPLTVRVTSSGLAGDAGVFCPYGMLFGGSLSRLRLPSQAAFDVALASREVHRVAERLTITHDAHCMAYCMGFTNSVPSPPFMSLGRNSDGVFGAMLAFTDPCALFAHLPHGVIHDSSRPSTYPHDDIPSASCTRLSDVMMSAVRQCGQPAMSKVPLRRMAFLAATLNELGQLDTAEFAHWFRHLSLDHMSRMFARADELAQDSPDYWRVTLDRYRQRFLERIGRPEFFLPAEFHATASLDEGFRKVQAFLRDYASFLRQWPTVWRAATNVSFAELTSPAHPAGH